jgi:hypothetical protein
MHQHGSLPLARQDGLIVEALGEELLLYDQNSHIAHCLSPIAACVWRHCDGERDATELAQLAEASENLVADALHELREKDLLDAEPQLMQSTIPGISRREAIGRGVRYGAAAAAVPLIVSATAATPAMAASLENSGCHKETGSSCCDCVVAHCKSGLPNRAECEKYCITELRSTIKSWAPGFACNGGSH